MYVYVIASLQPPNIVFFFTINMKTAVLLFIHAGRVSGRERDNLIAGHLLVFHSAICSDEGVQVIVGWGWWFDAALHVKQIEVGLSTAHLGGRQGRGFEQPWGRGGDEVVQGLTVVILQI